MRTIHKVINYSSRRDTFRLWHLTDWHVGARAFNEELFCAHVKAIAEDDHAFWIGGGDYIDGITHVGDKRYKPEALAPWVLGETDVMGVQMEYAFNLVKPIAHKCLGLVVGNHEWTAMNHYSRDIYWELVKAVAEHGKLDVHELALGAGGFIQLSFRRNNGNQKHGETWLVTIWAHHGFGGGRLPGGHALTLGRELSDHDCDLVLLGHRHVFHVISKTILKAGKTTARTKQSWGVFMPSYLGGFVEPLPTGKPIDTYPELLSLPATPMGAFPIEVRPNERKFALLINSDETGN